MTAAATRAPAAWATLECALRQQRPVQARYHDQQRVLCPHALGWRNGRAKVLVYQSTNAARPTTVTDPRQQWRSMFVDEIQDPIIIDEPWQTADNYSPHHNGIDNVTIAIGSPSP